MNPSPSLSDRELIALAVEAPHRPGEPPRHYDALPDGVDIGLIWRAMKRHGAASYDGFPAETEAVSDESLQRLSRIAKAILGATGAQA